MILLFGIVLLIILIALIQLAYHNHIDKNIPIIYIFFLLVTSPFIYLGTNKSQNFENFSGGRSSLGLFYTNTKSNKPQTTNGCNECPGICDYSQNINLSQKIQPLNAIDNPIQSKFMHDTVNPVQITVMSSPSSFSSYLQSTSTDANTMPSYVSNGDFIYIQYLPITDLLQYSNNNKSTKFFKKNIHKIKNFGSSVTSQIINLFNKSPINSYIIFGSSGNGCQGIVNANSNIPDGNLRNPMTNIAALKNTYNLQFISDVVKNSNLAAIIYKKDANSYITINQQIGNNMSANIFGQPLLEKGVASLMTSHGKQFKYEKPEETLLADYSLPYVQSAYNIISPVDTKSSSNLVINVENNQSIVYISPRSEDDQYVQYSKSPQSDTGPTSSTVLNTQQPQKWTIEPVNQTGFTGTYFIKTYTRPHYYLELNKNGDVKVNMFKGGEAQYWEIIENNGNYNIRHKTSQLYLAYSNFGGYLYEDNGSVITSQSNKYVWKINPSQLQKAGIASKQIDYNNEIKEFNSPTDFGNIDKPQFQLSGNINGKQINLSSSGRTYWEKQYTPLWNGKWIYYGTIATYGQNQPIDKTKFLQINMKDNGKGTVTDTYFNVTIPVHNAGSNIIMGQINSGQFKGFVAKLELIAEKLDYNGPAASYPVKLRYLVFNNNNIYNLSTGNINNLEGYSTKFDGKLLQSSNFLEASGIPVDIQKGLPK